jgi:hypothetical protein
LISLIIEQGVSTVNFTGKIKDKSHKIKVDMIQMKDLLPGEPVPLQREAGVG